MDMESDFEFKSRLYHDTYASLSRRFLAFLLDGLIVFFPCILGAHLIPMIGSILVWFFYFPILESSEVRATLGKYLLGIQVCDLGGRRISLRTAVIRNILKSVSSLLLFVGFIFALFTQKKQTVHDLLADTLVVYGRSNKGITDAWVERVQQLFQSFSKSQLDNPDSELDQLERLQELRAKGALTEEEFQEQKRRILNR